MDIIIMSALQLYFLVFLLGRLEFGSLKFGLFEVWSLAKVFCSSWDMPNPTCNNQQVPQIKAPRSSIRIEPAIYCSTLFGIVLGRHAKCLLGMLCKCATAGGDRDVGSDLHEKVMKKRKIMLYHQVNIQHSTLSARSLNIGGTQPNQPTIEV